MRILVTRPEPEAARTAARLSGLGHDPVLAPLFAPEAVKADLAVTADALAVTSPRTVAFLGPPVIARFRARPVFAVGDRTAEALRVAGFADVRSAAGAIGDLAALIVASDLAPGTVILSPGGEARAGDLAGALAGHGLVVEARAVYRMVALPALPETAVAALTAGTLDAVLHYSPNAATAFLRLAGAAGLASRLARLRHVCLSDAVAEPLRALGLPDVTVAAAPHEDALIAAIAGPAGLRPEGGAG